MKKKLNEYAKAAVVGVNDTIDSLLWFVIWGAILYFLLVMGAITMSAATLNQKLKGAYVKHPFSAQQIVAHTIFREARGEGEKGMYAVACVIQQRAKNRKMNLVEVCLQKKQFSYWNDSSREGNVYRRSPFNTRDAWLTYRNTPRSSPSFKYSNALAHEMLYKNKKLDQRVTGNADHYHNLQVKPYWADKKKKTVQIKNHIFYRLKN
tara:strand:- start:928 stop:1548 length:621 start_codon:yes stop_codon:yes gene_type:complete